MRAEAGRGDRGSPVIVIARGVGQLANRIVLFAHFIAAGVEHGFGVVNPAFLRRAHYFPSTSRDLLCRFPVGPRLPVPPAGRRVLYRAAVGAAALLDRRRAHGKDVGLIRLGSDEALDLNSDAFLDVVRRHRVVLVQGWFFRNSQNCARHREVVRTYFTPWSHHLDRARAAVEPLRRRDRFVVGVHVRRGDYSWFKDGRFYYSHEQYRSLMEATLRAFPDREVSFLVCSNEPVPAGAFAGLDVAYGNGHELEDLYALAGCDALVGPPSTYSKWASYYGDVPLHTVYDPLQLPEAESFEVVGGLESDRIVTR